MSKVKISPIVRLLADPATTHKFAYDQVIAIKALRRGDATEDQQRKVLDLIYDMTHARFQDVYPGEEAKTNFAGGKRFIGQQFAWAETMNLEEFNKPKPPKEKK